MVVSDAIDAVYLKAVGKTATFAEGTTKWTKILGLLNFYSRRWSRETGVDWNSLYNPLYAVGTITATDTFALDTDVIRKLSQQEGDNVRIVWETDSSDYTDYELVPADRLKEFNEGYYCCRLGSNLKFNKAFVSTDPQFGGTLYVPCYTYTDDLVNSTDEIQVDDPDWLVLMCAAEYVRTDLTRLGQYPNLLAEANDAMARMVDDNNNDQNTIVTDTWNPSPWNPSGTQWW